MRKLVVIDIKANYDPERKVTFYENPPEVGVKVRHIVNNNLRPDPLTERMAVVEGPPDKVQAFIDHPQVREVSVDEARALVPEWSAPLADKPILSDPVTLAKAVQILAPKIRGLRVKTEQEKWAKEVLDPEHPRPGVNVRGVPALEDLVDVNSID